MSRREDLEARLRKRRVLVVVGAGVSIAATGGASTASGKVLLDNGIDRCVNFAHVPPGWAERMRHLIDRPDLVADLDEEFGAE